MIVIKRDGREVNYDRSKIIVAISKANAEVPPEEKITEDVIESIVEYIETRHRKRMLVEDIQDIIEQKLMAEGKYDLAVAFDGDADRCLAVDEKGHVVNGDQMIAIFARQMKAEGRLPGDAAVVTVMSSFGFFRFAKENGILAETTKVGDRYVLENMRKNGYNIGGEQSGHIIFREYMPTGDGELSAIQLMRVMKKTGEPLSVLAGRMPITPQVLLNVAADRDMKEALHESPEMEALIEECEERLGDTGRILIRASGTEPLIRVMVEGEDAALIRELAERLAAGCEKLLK